MRRLFLIGLLSTALAATLSARQSDYVVGPKDVLTITVYDHADLSGTYKIEGDGSFSFPLIGRVNADGHTLRQIEEDIRARLADGYLRNPQVTVAVESYQSQRIFILGEVRAPGAYPLTGDMTVIEALSRAGSVTAAAADEVLIVRPTDGSSADGPRTEADADADVIRVNVRELQAGELSQNVALRHGDTLVVPKARAVYVFGQVRAPGAYPVDKGTTVLQALSLAGGVTDRGSTSRLMIVRTVDGEKKELKAKLTDTVEPGDTLIVKERFF
jgi:polysaccharide export outer membrane protein